MKLWKHLRRPQSKRVFSETAKFLSVNESDAHNSSLMVRYSGPTDIEMLRCSAYLSQTMKSALSNSSY
jgi:hypothetical protein